MNLRVGVALPARQLGQWARFAHIREAVEVVLAVLLSHILKMNAPLVNAHRRSCFHSSRVYAVLRDALRQSFGSRLRYTSALHHPSSDVHQSVQERTGCQYHAWCPKFSTPDGLHARYSFSLSLYLFCLSLYYSDRLNYQLLNLVLPDVQISRFIEHAAPLPDELATVALRPRTPYGWPFRAVQHPELDGCSIRHQSHLSTQGIYLAYNLTFGNAANGRVARHLRNLVHVHRDKQRSGTHIGRGRSSLATRMAAADDDYIILLVHSCFDILLQNYKNFCNYE